MSPARRAGLSLALGVLAACAGPRPSSFDGETGALLVVQTLRIPDSEPWFARFAEHTWIDLRTEAGADWWRVEVSSPGSGLRVEVLEEDRVLADERWGRRVSVLRLVRGEEARRAGERVLELARAHPDFGRREIELDGDRLTFVRTAPEREAYAAWPGPNSNTLIADLVEGTPGLWVDLDHNAVGKDYARGLRAGRTSAKLGVEVDTDYLGLGLGLRQGAELRLLGLTLGLGVWPPALKLPFLPRLGVHAGWTGTR